MVLGVVTERRNQVHVVLSVEAQKPMSMFNITFSVPTLATYLVAFCVVSFITLTGFSRAFLRRYFGSRTPLPP